MPPGSDTPFQCRPKRKLGKKAAAGSSIASAAPAAPAAREIIGILAFEDRLTALDKITGECRISLQDKYPVSGVISDPALTGSGSAVKLFISCARLPA